MDKVDAVYWREKILPLIQRYPQTEFLGEIGEAEKANFLGDAHALLFPVDWPELFGLVMIEAMACGTPVIAFRRGSVPEVVEEGVSGFVVDSVDEAAQAVGWAGYLRRADVRKAFERRFTADRMARAYSRLYKTLVEEKERTITAAVSSSADSIFFRQHAGEMHKMVTGVLTSSSQRGTVAAGRKVSALADQVGNEVGKPIERRDGAYSPSGGNGKQEGESLADQRERPSVALPGFRIPASRGSIFP